MLLELLVNGVIVGAKLGLAGLGFAIIYYTTREFHVAYGALLTLAGYIGLLAIEGWAFPVWAGIALSLTIAVAIGMILQYWVYRPLGDHFSVLMMALGISIVIENALQMWFGANDRILFSDFLNTQLRFGDFRIRYVELVVVASFLAVWAMLYYLLEHHRVGLALRAVMSDSGMAELVGVKAKHIRLMAYGLGSAVGAGSGLVMLVDSGLRPIAGFEVLLFAFIATILGMGSLHRVAVWSVLIGVIMNVVSWKLPTQFQTLIIFGLMFVYMLLVSRSKAGARA